MRIGWMTKHGLTLKWDVKDQKWSLGAHFMSKPVFERRRGEKGEKD